MVGKYRDSLDSGFFEMSSCARYLLCLSLVFSFVVAICLIPPKVRILPVHGDFFRVSQWIATSGYIDQEVRVFTANPVDLDEINSTKKTGSVFTNFRTPPHHIVFYRISYKPLATSHDLLLIVDIRRIKHLLCKLLVGDWLIMLLSNGCHKRRLRLNDAVGHRADKVRNRISGRRWLATGFT